MTQATNMQILGPGNSSWPIDLSNVSFFQLRFPKEAFLRQIVGFWCIETTKKALATTKVELKLPTALNLLSPVTFNSRPPSPSNFPCSPRTSVKWNNARRPSFVEMADAAASGASGVFQHFLTRKASKISIMETQA